jgi:hypothetical protein
MIETRQEPEFAATKLKTRSPSTELDSNNAQLQKFDPTSLQSQKL